jgi:hypothetical protein
MATIEELNGWQRSWPGTDCPVGVLGVAGVTLGVAKGQPAGPLYVGYSGVGRLPPPA